MSNGPASDPETPILVNLFVDAESEWKSYGQMIFRRQEPSMQRYYAGVRGHRCEVYRPPETARRQGLHPCDDDRGVPIADPLADFESGESGLRAGEVAVGDLEGVVPPPLAPLPAVGVKKLNYFSVPVSAPYPVGGRFGAARRVLTACDLDRLQKYYVGPPGARSVELWMPNEAASRGLHRCFRFEGPDGTRVRLADPLAEGAVDTDALLDLVDVRTGDGRCMTFEEFIASEPLEYEGDVSVANPLMTEVHGCFQDALTSFNNMVVVPMTNSDYKRARNLVHRKLAECHVLMGKVRKTMNANGLPLERLCRKHVEGRPKNPMVEVVNGLINLDLGALNLGWNAHKEVRKANLARCPGDYPGLKKVLTTRSGELGESPVNLGLFLKHIMIEGFAENRSLCPMFLTETQKAAEKRTRKEIDGELEAGAAAKKRAVQFRATMTELTKDNGKLVEELMEMKGEKDQCFVCYNAVPDTGVCRQNHRTCTPCLAELRKMSVNCPMCREPLLPSQVEDTESVP